MKIRLRVASSLGVQYMTPGGILDLNFLADTDSNMAEATPGLDGVLTFEGVDYQYFYNLDHSPYRSRVIEAQLQGLDITDNWVPKREAYLVLRDAQFNNDIATVQMRLNLKQRYQSLDEGFDKEYNLFNCAPIRYSAYSDDIYKPWNNGVRLYDVVSFILADIAGIANIRSDFFQWNSSNPAYAIGNSAKQHYLTIFQLSDIRLRDTGTFRFDFTGATAPFPKAGDIYSINTLQFQVVSYTDTGGGSGFLIMDRVFGDVDPPSSGTLVKVSGDSTVVNFSYGSWIFNGPTPATIMKGSLKQILGDLCAINNMEYRIDANGIFRIEHVSYWNRQIGIDLSGPNEVIYTRNAYDYTAANFYKRKTFEFTETAAATDSPDFMKATITYNNDYVVGLEEKTESVRTDFITDLPNASRYDSGDSGAVLLALKLDGEVESEPGVIAGGSVANNVLSWQVLIKHYHRYEMLFSEARVTSDSEISFGITITALSYKRTRSLKGVTFPYCDAENIDLFKTIKTEAGIGVIKSLKYNLYDNTVTADLTVEPDLSNVFAIPTARGDNFITKKNTTINSAAGALLTNDSDYLAASPVFAEVKQSEKGGTVTINADGSFQYIPPLDFYGQDTFTYILFGSGNYASIGTVTIGVKPTNIYVKYIAFVQDPIFTQQYGYWYSDPLGANPLNVNNYGLMLFYFDADAGVDYAEPGTNFRTDIHGYAQGLGVPASYLLPSPTGEYIII